MSHWSWKTVIQIWLFFLNVWPFRIKIVSMQFNFSIKRWNPAYGEFWQKKQLFLTHETLHKNKKQKPQNHLKPPWNPVSFTKTDKLETWNHFWFHENWQKSKSSLKINLWSLKLARFQNESEDRLHWEDALIFAKEDEFWLFCSFQDLICPKIRCLARSFFF